MLVRRYTAFCVRPELIDCVQVSLTLPPFALTTAAERFVGGAVGAPGGVALTWAEFGLSPLPFNADTT